MLYGFWLLYKSGDLGSCDINCELSFAVMICAMSKTPEEDYDEVFMESPPCSVESGANGSCKRTLENQFLFMNKVSVVMTKMNPFVKMVLMSVALTNIWIVNGLAITRNEVV